MPSGNEHSKPIRQRIAAGCDLSSRNKVAHQPGYTEKDTTITEPIILTKPRIILRQKREPILKVRRGKVWKHRGRIITQPLEDFLTQFS